MGINDNFKKLIGLVKNKLLIW